MKKLLLFVFALLLFVTSSMNAFAESNVDTTLEVNYSYDTETDRISINAFMVDIKPEEGIICVEYDIKYDASALELVKAETVFPEEWDTYIKNGSIEDLSHDKGNGVYLWSFVVMPTGIGAKEDNELGIKLEFKPLKKEATKVELLYNHVVTEVTENGFTVDVPEVSGSNATVSINFDKPTTPDIEKSDVTLPDESSDEDVSSVISNNESNVISNDDSSGNNGTTSDIVTLPSISVDITDASEDSSEVDLMEQKNENNWLIWTISAVGVAAVAILIFVLTKKRGDK